MKSEDYRFYLIECVKTAGQMIIDMAEDIVGNSDHISDLIISAEFDQEFYNSIPEITITRTHLPKREDLERLMNIHAEKIKGEKNEF